MNTHLLILILSVVVASFSQILLTSLGIPDDIREISSIVLRLNSSFSPTPAYFK